MDSKKFVYSFWMTLIESKGLEYVVRPDTKWGWHFFERDDFTIGLHLGNENPVFQITYKDEALAQWKFNGLKIVESVQDIMDVLDAVVDPKLWPLCVRIPWGKELVSKVLA